MGVVAGLGAAAAAASLGSTIAGATGGSSGGGPSNGFGTGVPQYQLGNPALADQNYINALSTYPSFVNNITGNNGVTGPNAQNAMNFAQTAATYGTETLAPAQQAAALGLQTSGMGALPFGNQILQTGFDPQNALYNRTQQQLLDQLNAVNAQQGLSGTPYGAGVIGQKLSDFNIDWQNNLLGRQATALGGYGNLIQGAGKALSGASDLGTGAVGSLSADSFLPLQTDININNPALQALGAQANLSSPYLGLQQAQEGIGLNAQGQGFNQGQILGANLGAGLGQLSSLFGGGTGGGLFGGGNPFGGPTADQSNGFLGSMFGPSLSAPGFLGGSYDAGASTFAPSSAFLSY